MSRVDRSGTVAVPADGRGAEGDAGVGAAFAARHHKAVRGVVATLLGGACWGLSGTIAKFLMSTYAIDPLWLVCVRELGSFWLFLLTAWFANRGQLVAVTHDRRAMLGILGVSLGSILLSQVAYLEAIDWTNSATATVLQSTNLVLVLAYVCAAKHRGPRRREVWGMALALAGTFLIATGGNPGQLQLPLPGLLWGLGTSVAAALLSILPVRLLNRWGSFVVNGFAMLFSGTVLSAFYRPWAAMPALDPAGVAWIVAIVVVGTYGAYALYLQGVKDVGSMRAGLLGTIEPVTATLVSVLWLGTAFSPADLVGFGMIIAMVYLTT